MKRSKQPDESIRNGAGEAYTNSDVGFFEQWIAETFFGTDLIESAVLKGRDTKTTVVFKIEFVEELRVVIFLGGHQVPLQQESSFVKRMGWVLQVHGVPHRLSRRLICPDPSFLMAWEFNDQAIPCRGA